MHLGQQKVFEEGIMFFAVFFFREIHKNRSGLSLRAQGNGVIDGKEAQA